MVDLPDELRLKKTGYHDLKSHNILVTPSRTSSCILPFCLCQPFMSDESTHAIIQHTHAQVGTLIQAVSDLCTVASSFELQSLIPLKYIQE